MHKIYKITEVKSMTEIEEIGFAEPRGKVEDIEKLKKILVSFITNLDSVKYKTELIKLCFVLDYKYCKKFNVNRGPTTVEYVKYNYGPYSDYFIEALESLKKEEIITETALTFGAGYVMNGGMKIELEESVVQLIKEVISEYGHKSLKEIKGIIYALPEFTKTNFGDVIVLN